MSYLVLVCPLCPDMLVCTALKGIPKPAETLALPQQLRGIRALRIHHNLPKVSTGRYTDADERKHRDLYAAMER